jgi:hypothetical protein
MIPGNDDSDGTLIEHWNGSAWSVNSIDAFVGFAAGLNGVADLSPTNAWAVGRGRGGGLLLHWNGSAWSQTTLADPAFTPASGDAISADSATDIWVVGNTVNATGTAVPEALHYNGTTWTVVAVPAPSQSSGTLSAVTAISPGNAWAVGEASGAGKLFAAATFPGAANEWAVGVNGDNQGSVLSHG